MSEEPGGAVSDGATRAAEALAASGIRHTLTTHGPVGSLEEAAAARGVEPRDIVKTIVVRRGEGDFLFVLVPGDREISWPKLRAHLGVNRLSMPDKDTARDVTGYVRGTITPFGSTTAWPVVADATVAGRTISIGAGAHGVAATAYGDDVIRALGAEVEDVTEPVAGQHD
jgi:Cys-tRNA(Pro)/Cys-tRNA(Cys) deacylase